MMLIYINSSSRTAPSPPSPSIHTHTHMCMHVHAHTHTHTHTHAHTHTHMYTHTQRFTGRLETVGSVRSKRQRQDECWAVTWKKTKSEHVTQRKGDCSRERDQYTVQANSPSALHKTLSQTKTKGIRLPEESASPRMMGGCLDAFIMEVKVTTSDLVRQPPPLHSPRIRIIRYFCSKASHQTLTWPLNQHTSYFCSRAPHQTLTMAPESAYQLLLQQSITTKH